MMKDAKLTIRLPAGELAFAKEYAREHSFSLTALVLRYFMRLRTAEARDVAPEVRGIAGIVPSKVDARRECHEHRARKHR